MRPTRDWVCMEMARLASNRSTCSRSQVGAVIALEGRVLSTGYNGAAAGLEHCSHQCTCSVAYLAGQAKMGRHDTHVRTCESQKKCEVSVHAEANAIAFAARHGVALQGATLYTTLSPCLDCAKLVINAGIVEVIVGELYRLRHGVTLLEKAGIVWSLLA